MPSSGTFNFNPYESEVTLECFERCGIRSNALTQDMLVSAQRSFNYTQAIFSNRGVNLWATDQQNLSLVPGTATYTLQAPLIDILPEAVLEISTGGVLTDRVLFPLSRADYTAIASKTQQGPPTSFWLNRQIIPTITFWPVPDSGGPYNFIYWRFRQLQDATIGGPINPEVPFRFLEAYVSGVAAHIAMKWAPERAEKLFAYANTMWKEASDADREKVSLRVVGAMEGYFQ